MQVLHIDFASRPDAPTKSEKWRTRPLTSKALLSAGFINEEDKERAERHSDEVDQLQSTYGFNRAMVSINYGRHTAQNSPHLAAASLAFCFSRHLIVSATPRPGAPKIKIPSVLMSVPFGGAVNCAATDEKVYPAQSR